MRNIYLLLQYAEITVGFDPSVYMFTDGMGAVFLMLVVSNLDSGVLECPVDVTIDYTDGAKASKNMFYDS